MIRLCVEEYCQECDQFVAEVKNDQLLYGNDKIRFRSDTIIRCERRDLCARLQKEFERINKEKENGTCKEM